MRPAPGVAVTASGGGAWRAVQAVLPALAVAAITAFVLLHRELAAWPAWIAGVAVALGGWRLARPRAQTLRWDGQVWTLGGTPGRLAVMIDVGPALLLRLRPEARRPARWLAITRKEAGSEWHALRAALYSRPSKTNAPRVLPTERADC